MNRILAILSFHKIGAPSIPEWETWFYIPESIFVLQLEWLRINQWHVIGMGDFLHGLAEPDSLAERSVLLTFDDGYRSMATIALPCLQRFRFPGVVFIPTDYIGGTNSFDTDEEPPEPMCTWEDLRRLESGGVSVQSHGVKHRSFSGLSPAEQHEELNHSKRTLESGLQKPVEAFAFPYGDGGTTDVVSAALARLGYRAGFLYGANETYAPAKLPVSDPYRIDRVAMGPDTDLSVVLGETALRIAL
jgi:peptidoglycan/xylan/chitin deacetylase (PgdA/CDA1 family)